MLFVSHHWYTETLVEPIVHFSLQRKHLQGLIAVYAKQLFYVVMILGLRAYDEVIDRAYRYQ